jgi:protein CWC15
LKAEEEARAKKRKAAGLPQEDTSMTEIEDRDPEEIKRRKLLQDIALDKDDDEDEDETDQPSGQDAKMGVKGDR